MIWARPRASGICRLFPAFTSANAHACDRVRSSIVSSMYAPIIVRVVPCHCMLFIFLSVLFPSTPSLRLTQSQTGSGTAAQVAVTLAFIPPPTPHP